MDTCSVFECLELCRKPVPSQNWMWLTVSQGRQKGELWSCHCKMRRCHLFFTTLDLSKRMLICRSQICLRKGTSLSSSRWNYGVGKGRALSRSAQPGGSQVLWLMFVQFTLFLRCLRERKMCCRWKWRCSFYYISVLFTDPLLVCEAFCSATADCVIIQEHLKSSGVGFIFVA